MNRRLVVGLGLTSLLCLASCAPNPVVRQTEVWEGRLALTVPSPGTAPSGAQDQNYFAGFELTGHAQNGQMRLLSPLGQTLAQLRWSPTGAQLQQGDVLRDFDSVQAMSEALTGQALPLPTFFDWLEGRPGQAPGWVVDLSERAAGKITARRLTPPALLKVILQP